jgi:uncharacterized protein (DUF305 family)
MYLRLLLMAVLSFISMYVLMYMMVDKYDDVFPNLNQLYMAGMMTAPMIIFELLLMGSMYKNKKVNLVLIGLSIVLLALFSFFIRRQTGISDKEFLKSMIPHHGGAVLMCRNAEIQDAEITQLCQSIISSQQSEIDLMKRKLRELR